MHVSFSPLGFSSRDGQVESTAYQQSQQELQQRQMAERTAQAEQAIMQAAREAEMAREAQRQREAQDRQMQIDAEQQRETQRRHDEQQTRDRYVQELFQLTAPAAALHAHQPHPELSGASAGNIHSSAALMGRDWATQYNAQQPANEIPSYHTEAPVITYSTDIPTTDMMRTHNARNQVGGWTTNGRDIDYGDISGEEAKRRLSLSDAPTYVSDVSVAIGTFVTAGRPESGAARQYNFVERISSWFSNRRNLG